MSKLLIIFVLLLVTMIGYSQTKRTIKGEILDPDEKPVPGMTVILLGTVTGTVTDINGRFELTVDNDPIIYIRLSGLDLEIYLKYSEKEEFKKVTLKNWKKTKKESNRISEEWNRKAKALEKNHSGPPQ